MTRWARFGWFMAGVAVGAILATGLFALLALNPSLG